MQMRIVLLMEFNVFFFLKVHFPQLSQTSLWQNGMGNSYEWWVLDFSKTDCLFPLQYHTSGCTSTSLYPVVGVMLFLFTHSF